MKKSIYAILASLALASTAQGATLYDPTPLLDYDGGTIAILQYLTTVEYQWIKPEDTSLACVYVPSLGVYGYIPAYLAGGSTGSTTSSYSYQEPVYTAPEPEYTAWYPEEVWVEVDISDQIVSLHQDNDTLAWGSTVTGNATKSPTPEGNFNIYLKAENEVLRGYNYDGSTYASEVRYWMPFLGGYGLHDAQWRTAFGGDIYQYAGSHGCVNLPYSLAEAIWDKAPVGTRVNIHK